MDSLPVEIPLVFTQEQFDEYSRLSGDDNPIHVDRSFAARTRFGRTVAHGMFIFGVMNAQIARALGGPIVVSHQSLMFSRPTFARDPLVLQLDRSSDGRVIERLVDHSDFTTSSGEATLGTRLSAPLRDDAPEGHESFKGLSVGMHATRNRRFNREDVEDFVDLVDDPNPLFHGDGAEVPPALIGGTVSWLLGVDLPGPGTNWLKQEYTFHHSIPVPSEVETTVTITRLRPDKELVDLATVCTAQNRIVATGRSLVLARDIAPG